MVYPVIYPAVLMRHPFCWWHVSYVHRKVKNKKAGNIQNNYWTIYKLFIVEEYADWATSCRNSPYVSLISEIYPQIKITNATQVKRKILVFKVQNFNFISFHDKLQYCISQPPLVTPIAGAISSSSHILHPEISVIRLRNLETCFHAIETPYGNWKHLARRKIFQLANFTAGTKIVTTRI